MQKCPNCGYKNSFNALNCQLCNHDLSSAPQTGRPLGGDPNVVFGAGLTTRRFAGATERYYMVPMVGDQVKLEPGFTYLIGRDVACQIRVSSPKASRKHAELKFEGNPPKPIVKDLGGQNGTRVNGQPLPKEGTHELQDHDDVEVGDVHLTYRKLAPGESEKMLREEAGETTMPSMAVPSKADYEAATTDGEEEAAVMGNAAIIPLADILKRLEALRATGKLVVESGNLKGFVQLQGGRTVGGSFGGASGPQAAAAVAALTTGRFRFEAAEQEAAPQPPESTRPTVRMAPMAQPPLPAAQPSARPTGPVARPGAAPGQPAPPRPAGPPVPAPRPVAAPGQGAPPPPRPAAPPSRPAPPPGAPRPAAPPPPRPNPPPKPPGT